MFQVPHLEPIQPTQLINLQTILIIQVIQPMLLIPMIIILHQFHNGFPDLMHINNGQLM